MELFVFLERFRREHIPTFDSKLRIWGLRIILLDDFRMILHDVVSKNKNTLVGFSVKESALEACRVVRSPCKAARIAGHRRIA